MVKIILFRPHTTQRKYVVALSLSGGVILFALFLYLEATGLIMSEDRYKLLFAVGLLLFTGLYYLVIYRRNEEEYKILTEFINTINISNNEIILPVEGVEERYKYY